MHEFDVGAQDKSLFEINEKIKTSCTPFNKAIMDDLPVTDHHAFLSLYTVARDQLP